MNKKYGISTGILVVVLLVSSVLGGCKSGGTKAPKVDLTTAIPKDNSAALEDVTQAKKVFDALPSPIESAMLIKSAGARFDNALLNPVGNVSNYVSSKSMALYGDDGLKNVSTAVLNETFASMIPRPTPCLECVGTTLISEFGFCLVGNLQVALSVHIVEGHVPNFL